MLAAAAITNPILERLNLLGVKESRVGFEYSLTLDGWLPPLSLWAGKMVQQVKLPPAELDPQDSKGPPMSFMVFPEALLRDASHLTRRPCLYCCSFVLFFFYYTKPF